MMSESNIVGTIHFRFKKVVAGERSWKDPKFQTISFPFSVSSNIFKHVPMVFFHGQLGLAFSKPSRYSMTMTREDESSWSIFDANRGSKENCLYVSIILRERERGEISIYIYYHRHIHINIRSTVIVTLGNLSFP